MASNFAKLIEDLIARVAEMNRSIASLSAEDTLTQAAVKDTEPEDPYPGYIWVDIS